MEDSLPLIISGEVEELKHSDVSDTRELSPESREVYSRTTQDEQNDDEGVGLIVCRICGADTRNESGFCVECRMNKTQTI